MCFKYNMNILPINIKSYTPNFKSYIDDGIIGYDDSISQERRNLIREHYSKWHTPYQSIYEKGGRLTNYQMNLLIEQLKRKHAIQNIEGTTIYRGQTLVDKPCYLHNLQDKGIKTVIDLVDYGDTYKESVTNAGLKYYKYNIYDNWWNRYDFASREYINELVKFLSKMQEGNIYIACQHGANDTDIALILNDFFNPLLEDKCPTTIPPNDSDFPIKLNTIYDALKKSDKKKLGWTKEFEKRLIKKLISI